MHILIAIYKIISGDYDNAILIQREIVKILQVSHGADHALTLSARHTLGYILLKTTRDTIDTAKRLPRLAEAMTILNAVYLQRHSLHGPEDIDTLDSLLYLTCASVDSDDEFLGDGDDQFFLSVSSVLLAYAEQLGFRHPRTIRAVIDCSDILVHKLEQLSQYPKTDGILFLKDLCAVCEEVNVCVCVCVFVCM